MIRLVTDCGVRVGCVVRIFPTMKGSFLEYYYLFKVKTLFVG